MKRKFMISLLLLAFVLTSVPAWAARASTPDGFSNVTGLSVDQGIQQPVTAKVADYSPAESESGTVFTNTGATETLTFVLPDATNMLGRPFPFANRNGLAMSVKARDTDQIKYPGLNLGAGDKLTASVAGASITLVAVDDSTYVPLAATGTWTDGGG